MRLKKYRSYKGEVGAVVPDLCLLACGIIPREGHTLGKILERLGSAFVMHSEVTNVPKGSGLGTSSILSAACVLSLIHI